VRHNRSVFVVFGLVAIVLNACDPATDTKPKALLKKPDHLVQTAPVTFEALRHETVRTGSLAARRSVRVFNQEEGRIETVGFYEGDLVKKSALLVTMDSRLLEAQLEKAKALSKQAAADHERVLNLAKRKIASQQQRIEAETALRVTRSEETQLVARLGYTRIRAPFAGVVTERLSEPGDVAPRFSHLLTVIDPSSLYTKVTISELLLPRLKVGDRVSVRIDALGDSQWQGRIQRIHPVVDPRTRQGVVEVGFESVPPGSSAGQLCRVTLRTAETTRKMIPFAALRRDVKGDYVFVVSGGKAAKKAIHTGLRLGDRVEVLDGLESGEQVVVRGILDLSPGKAVKVVKAAATKG
jgi:RND family efflux transporter MFP subunit